MKNLLALLALAVFTSTLVPAARAGDPVRLTMSFSEILALPKGRALIFTPVRITAGKSLAIHSFINSNAPARPNGGERGAQVFVFLVQPDNSSVDAFRTVAIPTATAAGTGGAGAGKVSMQDIHFSDVPMNYLDGGDGARLIVAVVGYDVPRTGAAPVPFPLPKELSLTAQVDVGGTALLLPAVQKVREAAAR